MVLALRYGSLSSTISEMNKLSNEIEQYCDDLSRKVQRKMYDVEGGSSAALNSADYYVKQKIQQLRKHKENAWEMKKKTENLLDTAKRVDNDVKRVIEAEKQVFFNRNPDMKSSNFKQKFVSFLCDLKDVPLIGQLIKDGEKTIHAISALKKSIRYWYKCQGGKEFVGIVLSVVEAIAAAILVICAVVITGGVLAVICGIAGLISAVIGYVNSITNIVTSFQAYEEAVGGHPGKAKIYAGQDKLSDVLRETNFHDKEKNHSSNAWATGIEITDTVCSIISSIKGINSAWKGIKGKDIKKTIRSLCQPVNGQGKPTLWNGIKSISLKFNAKDFLLGDLNVKGLSKALHSSIKDNGAFDILKSITKAIKGINSDLDKINEGKQSGRDFIAKRMTIGLNKTFLEEQIFDRKEKKYVDTDFSKVIKKGKIVTDDLGLFKLLTGNLSDDISYQTNAKNGLWQNFMKIRKQTQIWESPQVGFEKGNSGKVTEVENWDSAKGYFDKRKVEPQKSSLPKMEIYMDMTLPMYVLPTIKFQIKFNYRYPYYNVNMG